MILVTNRVNDDDKFIDKRLSQAGLTYQKKLKEFSKPTFEIVFVPSFLNLNYRNDADKSIFFINSGRAPNLLKFIYYFLDSFRAFFQIVQRKESNIYIYNLDLQNIFFVFLSCIFLNKKVYLVIADFITYQNFFLKELFMRCYMLVDGVLILNNNINVHDNSVLLPGLIREREITEPKLNINKQKNIIFSGSIGMTTGFALCVKAFSKVKNINLHISGKPYHMQESEILDLIHSNNINNNIFYHGLLSEENYGELLKQCDVALSLRNPEDEEHNFNFPSKILEYLSKGKIVISSKKYEFISDEVIDYIEFSEKSLIKCIQKICKYTDDQFYKRQKIAINYVRNNFTEKTFVKKIKILESYDKKNT